MLGAEDGRLQIDRGLTDGLRRGDRGDVFYRLSVGRESRRIDLGPVEVISLAAESAVTSAPVGAEVRPGFLVEFALDKERFSPGSLITAAREELGDEAAEALARRYRAELEPSGETVAPAAAVPAPAEIAPPHADAPEPVAEVASPPAPPLIRIDPGSYAIGLDGVDARFFNETPRFRKNLTGFAIDPAAEGPAGLDFAAAEKHCAARGLRLPTEFEWEVAARHPRFEIGERFEWTSSWYLAYPGNRRAEEEYGQRFRVLRGATDPGFFRPQERHYFEPSSSSSKVGFRCAASAG